VRQPSERRDAPLVHEWIDARFAGRKRDERDAFAPEVVEATTESCAVTPAACGSASLVTAIPVCDPKHVTGSRIQATRWQDISTNPIGANAIQRLFDRTGQAREFGRRVMSPIPSGSLRYSHAHWSDQFKARIARHMLLACCLSAAACTDESEVTSVQPTLATRISRTNTVPERNSDRDYAGASKRYSDESDSTRFEMASSGDTVFIVGLKLPGTRRGSYNGEVYVDEASRQSSDAALRHASLGIRIVGRDSILPVLYAKVPTRDALSRLRRFPFVDYVEPNRVGKDFAAHSGDPCGVPAPGLPISYDANGEIVNPPFVTQNIVAAWAVIQGEGATLGLADALVDDGQREFYADASYYGSGFSGGLSVGRFFEQQTPAPGVTGSTCSHATRMAILMAAPRNGWGTNGVAWKASLRSGGPMKVRIFNGDRR
jgi:hypothetical protein